MFDGELREDLGERAFMSEFSGRCFLTSPTSVFLVARSVDTPPCEFIERLIPLWDDYQI